MQYQPQDIRCIGRRAGFGTILFASDPAAHWHHCVQVTTPEGSTSPSMTGQDVFYGMVEKQQAGSVYVLPSVMQLVSAGFVR